MSEVKKYKKWGMPFAIIGFIFGIQAFVNSGIYAMLISMLWTGPKSSGMPGANMELMRGLILSAVISSMAIGAIASIIGIIGWKKKALATLGLVFTLIPILFYLAMFLTNGFREGLF